MSESEKENNDEIVNDERIDTEIRENNDDDKNENIQKRNKKNKSKYVKKKWNCEDQPLWRIYMNSYLEREEKFEREDKFGHREAAVLPKFPNVKTSDEISSFHSCFPFNTFDISDRTPLPDKLKPNEKLRLWRFMKNDAAMEPNGIFPKSLADISRNDSDEWPKIWPCVKRDLFEERRKLEKLAKRKRKGLLPCQEDSDDEIDPNDLRDNFADRKELGHARIPITCSKSKKRHLVDRAIGEQPGLVNGDYIILLFDTRNDERSKRSYANVCLRGMKGMHLVELRDERVREKTWKFCFYQAIVALLAKTQFRYKFVWSANIDYIYDHAWMLFVHMGSINVKERIRLDDVTVYNYKYSVELELVHETREAPRITGIDENYVEEDLTKMFELERPELLKIKEEIGSKRPKHKKPSAVHKITEKIEEWFDELPDIYHNCVFRTNKYSLAFWKDGTFWYLFNPYRCDEFGLWYDDGYASILKFCTRTSLKRHLMILLIRAYSYEPKSPLKLSKQKENNKKKGKSRKIDDNGQTESRESSEYSSDEGSDDNSTNSESKTSDVFTIQIFQMIYRCVKIENIKLLQRKPPNPPTERIKKKDIDNCGLDSLLEYESCSQNQYFDDSMASNEKNDIDTMEKACWLKNFKVTWSRFAARKKNNVQGEDEVRKLCWHQYYVEEAHRIFTLWGEIHPTEEIFAEENRGKQIYACYVVCAGMTRIQAPEYWSPKTLDAIVMCGDRFYTMSNLENENLSKKHEIHDSTCWKKYLRKYFKIGETMFEGNVLSAVSGELYNGKGKCLWENIQRMFVKHHFGILSCENSCLGIFKFCGAYYMFDVNSFGPPLFEYGNGVAYLIRATSFYKFMTVLVLTIGSNECSRFTINPIEIGKIIDIGTGNLEEKKGYQRFRKMECPYVDAAKDSKKCKSKNSRKRKETIERASSKKSKS